MTWRAWYSTAAMLSAGTVPGCFWCEWLAVPYGQPLARRLLITSWVMPLGTSCSGTDFIANTQKLAATSRGQGLHQLGPIQVQVNGNRAFAKLPAQIVMPVEIDGQEATLFVWQRMCFRVEKREDDWRIAEFRAVYLKDSVAPEYVGDRISLDTELLSSYRRSYRYTQYWSNQAGWGDHPDRPGIDRPELMRAVYEDNARWLAESAP